MEKITGVTDEQLSLLVEGKWFDWDTTSNSPCWMRWVLVEDGKEDAEGRIWQRISCDGFRWWARVAPNVGLAYADNLDNGLTQCDDWAGTKEIATPEGEATKQEERFARWAGFKG